MNREYHENENGGIFCVRVPKETSEKVLDKFCSISNWGTIFTIIRVRI